MPRTEAQLQAIREKTRKKILTAATQVFSARGFAATNMVHISHDANISVGLIYRHFKTKEDLFGALLHQAATGLDDVGHFFSQPLPPDQLFKSFTDEIIDDLNHNDEFSQLMMLVSQAFMMEDFLPEATALMKHNQSMTQQVSKVILAGQREGVFKEGNPEIMAHYYFSSINGLAQTKFTLKDTFVAPTQEMILGFLMKENS